VGRVSVSEDSGEFERVVELISEFKNKKYKCSENIDKCLLKFIEELDRELKRLCNNWCFVETYDTDSDTITIAIGALDTVLVELDYKVEHTVKIKDLFVRKI
jgi:hypothetical protein